MNSVFEWLNLRRLGFAVIFLVILTFIVLFDPDYFWHLRTGQYILEQRALPSGDIFSYTYAGQPWVLHEWLFEIMLYGVHALLGQFGVKLLTATLATSALVVSYYTAKRLLGKPYLAFFLILMLALLIAPSIAPRPQLVTFVMFAVFLHVLMEFKYFQNMRVLWALPPLMVLWVNAHGGFVAGIALMMLFTACEWVKFITRQQSDEMQRGRLHTLALTTAAVILASLLNPNFIGLWLYPFEVMNMEAARSLIAEWRSPDFHSLLYQVFLALVFVALTTAMYREKRPDITEIAVPLFFIAMGFVAYRHVPLAMLALVFFAATTISQIPFAQTFSSPKLNQLAQMYRSFVGTGGELGKIEFVLNWLILLFVAIGCLLYYPIYHASESDRINKTVPVKATKFVIDAGIQGNMFNIYHHGGYLIDRLYPTQQVFIDGRGDMYGDQFILEYMLMQSGGSGWKEKFDKYNIDYVITSRNSALVELLQVKGNFSLVYEDEVNSVLVKNNEKFARIIAKYGK